MNIPTSRWLVLALVPSLFGCGAARADAAISTDLILPPDPRFNVFELANSAGDGTFASPHGTVVLSFATRDSRYCRAARITSDSTFVLACRAERGWKIEAVDSLAAGESTTAAPFGGGSTREVADAVESLRVSPDFLDASEIIDAAGKGWRDPVPVDEQALGAQEILKRTGQVYRAGKSYIDAGAVQTLYTTPSQQWTGKTYFKTAYVAPFDFRFESNMREVRGVEVDFIAWSDRNGFQAWYNLDPNLMKDLTSIRGALDAGAGISRDSSGMIPGLIIPGTKLGGDIVRLTSALRLEDALIDGYDCFQVQGFRWPNTGEPTTVWIDKESFLIRRVYEEGKVKDVATKTTWFYKPAINVPVEPGSLLFNKPTP